MVNAQEWLDVNYPKEERSTIKELNFSHREEKNEEKLAGSLKLEGFISLEKLDCEDNELTALDFTECSKLWRVSANKNKLTYLDLTCCPKLRVLGCRWNQLTELDVKKCKELEELYASDNQLNGLDLSQNYRLREIYCRGNKMEYLKLPNPSNFRILWCAENFLTELNLSACNPEKLIELALHSNNLSSQSLDCFSQFVNLHTLRISNEDERKMQKGIRNHFYGPLKSLRSLVRLERLYVDNNPEIEGDLEYLPINLGTFGCEGCPQIIKYLEDYKGNLLSWRENNKEKVQKSQTFFHEREQQINYLELRIQELIHLIKTQKQKIIQDFLNILPEKELIQQLITTYLEFKKAEKQKLPSRKLERECNRIKDELEDKLGEEFVEKIQFILSDCEMLVNWEIELEERLKNKTLYIEEQKQALKQITYSDENNERKIVEAHEATQQKQLQQARQVINQLRKHLQSKTQQVSTLLEYQIIDKREQLTNLLATLALVPTNQERIVLIQEEIKVLQEELEKVEKNEQTVQIQQTELLPRPWSNK